MYLISGAFIIVGILLGIALGYVIGKLRQELISLQDLVEHKRRTQSDIALFEDAVAIVTDLAVRQDVEKKRNEAVSHYIDVRLAQLGTILGEGRNGFEYQSKPANRPKDY